MRCDPCGPPYLVKRKEDHLCKAEIREVQGRDPCGTPTLISALSNVTPLTLQHCLGLWR